MGRPLNKKYFGTPTDSGNEIKVTFFNGAAGVDGWIVKQTGSKRFKCTDGTVTRECVLVDKVSGDLVAGDMSITVKDDAGNVARAVKITAHRMTKSDGNTSAWSFSDATDDEYLEIEEAGSKTVIDVIDAVNGEIYEIVDLGNTVWEDFDADGDNSPYEEGDTFVMSAGPGTGTGTVMLASDDFIV
jgi:hypothetical protein